jgi:polyhydroxybutyrate depolymerase
MSCRAPWPPWIITVLVGLSAISCAAQGTRRRAEMRLTAGGHERSAIVYVPALADDSRAHPLVVVLHGHFGSGAQAERSMGFDPLADRFGFILAYPNGVDRGWNDGRSDAGGAHFPSVDDVTFLDSLIDRIEASYRVDARRVYIAGHSNGAFMANRFAAERPQRVAAVASVAGTLGVVIVSKLEPKTPVSSLDIWGSADRLVPPTGGEVRGHHGRALGAEALSAWWAKHDGCSDRTEAAPSPSRVVARRYTGCPAGLEVENVEVVGEGHIWPGAKYTVPGLGLLIGPETRALNAAEAIWDFFAKHSTSAPSAH